MAVPSPSHFRFLVVDHELEVGQADPVHAVVLQFARPRLAADADQAGLWKKIKTGRVGWVEGEKVLDDSFT